MKLIKAIVLTYDRNRVLTDHMIQCYEKLWPNHPFIFQVPYQELPPSVQTNRVQYTYCPADIQGTVRTLLHNLDDEEMVYWCIDDKYPIWLNIRRIENIHQYLFSSNESIISGLLFCRCRGMWNKKNLTGKKWTDNQGNVYLERRNYQQIWIHQYLKVKVLRHLFNSFPEQIPTAKAMDHFKDKEEKPKSHQIFVTHDNLSIFGESTSRGVLTLNCLNSLNTLNLKAPAWASEVTPYEIRMGDNFKTKFSLFIHMLTKRFI